MENEQFKNNSGVTVEFADHFGGNEVQVTSSWYYIYKLDMNKSFGKATAVNLVLCPVESKLVTQVKILCQYNNKYHLKIMAY